MPTTLAILLGLAATSGPPMPTAAARDPLWMARNPAAESRLIGRLGDDPARLNPGWGAGWAAVATFGGEEFDPIAQRPHPGLPPAPRNRLKLGWSYRLEHWEKGTDPASRAGLSHWPGPGQ